ncbi:MAG: type II secretion system protein GspD [Verrucomicrobiales bacterium]
MVDQLIEQITLLRPRMVEIEAKFVEISQNDYKELSFDWLLGQFNLGSGSDPRTFAGGGTQGPVRGATGDFAGDFPFVDPSTGQAVGNFPLTSGNRTGTGPLGAISSNAIDALLFQTPSGIASGTFALAGVFTDPQFQMVVRAIDQKKGVDLLSAPRVVTKSGNRAVIEIIREFIYPTSFSPPELPQEVSLSSPTRTTTIVDGIPFITGGDGGSQAFPVTPATPETFETRNTGVTLEVEPIVGPDGYTVELTLQPNVTEFEGFINYGSPIIAGGEVITDNVINQPIFSTRKVNTSVTIWDGQTVSLGGLIREDVQKVEDKVPLLGDIPIAGRLFRNTVEQHLKRNLIIFVTARLIDPAGQPIRLSEAEEMLMRDSRPAAAPVATPEAPLPPLEEAIGDFEMLPGK